MYIYIDLVGMEFQKILNKMIIGLSECHKYDMWQSFMTSFSCGCNI